MLCLREFLVLILRTLFIKKEILLSYNLNTDSDTLKEDLFSVFNEPYNFIWQGTDLPWALGEWVILLSGDI